MIQYLSLGIVVATIVGVAVGSWPALKTNRSGISLIGAAALMSVGALTMKQAIAGLDFGTLLLLFSMMVINASLDLAGFFRAVAHRIAAVARGPKTLLALIIVVCGTLSALFLNDTLVLMLTPMVLEVARTLRRNPLPYLIGLAISANIGSVFTITGNPQNMIIGIASRIGFLDFSLALIWVTLLGFVICWGVIVLVYWKEFRDRSWPPVPIHGTRVYRPLLVKTLLVIVAMFTAFLSGVELALAAFAGTAVLLFTRRVRSERIFRKIDWGLLTFFAGLFVVTHSLEVQGWTTRLFESLSGLASLGLVPFGMVTVVLSNLISNVPTVLLLKELVPGFADPNRAWLMLAASSTLAGNLTLLGSVANLIMAELSAKNGVRLGFWEYLKVGLPVTLLTLGVAFLTV